MPFSSRFSAAVVDLDSRSSGGAGSGGGGGAGNAGLALVSAAARRPLDRVARLTAFADLVVGFVFTFREEAFLESFLAGAEALALALAGPRRMDLAGTPAFFLLPPLVILRGTVFAIRDPLTVVISIRYNDCSG